MRWSDWILVAILGVYALWGAVAWWRWRRKVIELLHEILRRLGRP